MQERTSQLLFAYWNELRGDRVAPKRFEVEPSRISSILPETFILETNETDVFRFRLAGTRICEDFGNEFRGTDFLDLWQGEDLVAIKGLLRSIRDDGATGVGRFDCETADKRTVSFEFTILPLMHTHNHMTRMLGSICAIDHPAWLGHSPLISFQLEHLQTVWPDGRPHAVVARMERNSAFVDREPTRIRGPLQARRRFRVYEGGLSSSYSRSSGS